MNAASPPGADATPAPFAAQLTLRDFDFALPPELIAQHPAAERSGSRLLDGSGALAVDRRFRDLPALLNDDDLLVFNDTRVIRARLFGSKTSGAYRRGGSRDGGRVEVLVERVLPGREVLAHVRASKSPKAGGHLRLGTDAPDRSPTAAGFDAEVLGRAGPGGALFRLRFPDDPLALLERHGHVPLPPYIDHADSADDARRYQTVFAARPGAVAAPTAALHFDDALLAALRVRGVRLANVTLHVGAGTFQPVRSSDLAQHRMHSEWYEVSAATQSALAAARARGGRIVAVGTTTLRALESAARSGDLFGAGAEPQTIAGDTDIFITPGFAFRVVDALVTNFHLPRSTLLMLVSAFAGHRHAMALYRYAIAQRYRFFSYGDAMWLTRAPPGTA